MTTALCSRTFQPRSGRGEVILHNLKNWSGYCVAGGDTLDGRDLASFARTVEELFVQADSLVRGAVSDGTLPASDIERLGRLLEQPRAWCAALNTGNVASAFRNLAEFLKQQHDGHGHLYQAIQGETITLADDVMALDIVEQALAYVVGTLAPPLALRYGVLRFSPGSNERDLVIATKGGNGICVLGIRMEVGYARPIRLARVREAALAKQTSATSAECTYRRR